MKLRSTTSTFFEVTAITQQTQLIDQFQRRINYLRLSVTDRCDFRCVYCMAEDMTFLPRDQVLSLEEMAIVAKAFRGLGVDKLRVTGGEPLIRKEVIKLFAQLGEMGFHDLSLTTNGARLTQFAPSLVDAGVHRVNVSLDTLRPNQFRQLTRTGNLSNVLDGIYAAKKAGFNRIKINCVVLKHFNTDQILPLTQFVLENELDISFIEEMPLGEIRSHSRQLEFISSEEIRQRLSHHMDLLAVSDSTGGPSRYWTVKGHNSRIGFISPHSENFCSTCNRVRLSAEGRLLLCLGNEHSVDLRKVLRSTAKADQAQALQNEIIRAMDIKPEKHHFSLNEAPQILRFMNATGG